MTNASNSTCFSHFSTLLNSHSLHILWFPFHVRDILSQANSANGIFTSYPVIYIPWITCYALPIIVLRPLHIVHILHAVSHPVHILWIDHILCTCTSNYMVHILSSSHSMPCKLSPLCIITFKFCGSQTLMQLCTPQISYITISCRSHQHTITCMHAGTTICTSNLNPSKTGRLAYTSSNSL